MSYFFMFFQLVLFLSINLFSHNHISLNLIVHFGCQFIFSIFFFHLLFLFLFINLHESSLLNSFKINDKKDQCNRIMDAANLLDVKVTYTFSQCVILSLQNERTISCLHKRFSVIFFKNFFYAFISLFHIGLIFSQLLKIVFLSLAFLSFANFFKAIIITSSDL